MLTFLGIEPKGLEACAYSSRILDEAALVGARSDEPFAREAVAVLKELLQSVTLVARVRRVEQTGQPRTLSRDEAILAGQMVRLTKLHEGLLAYCSPPRMELFAFVLRGVIETAVNLRYLLEHGSPEVFDAYVRDSLRLDSSSTSASTRRLRRAVAPSCRWSTGCSKASSGRSERRASNSTAWMRTLGKGGRRGAPGAGLRLWAWSTSTASTSVSRATTHGAWQELYQHHLTAQPGGQFLPRLEFEGLAVPPLLMAIEVLTASAVDYLHAAAPESSDRDTLEDRLGFCGNKGQAIRAGYRRFRGMPS